MGDARLVADIPSSPPTKGDEGNGTDSKHVMYQRKLRSAVTKIESLRLIQGPKKPQRASIAPVFETQYQGLDAKIVDLCESNVPLRRRLAHLSMTHVDEKPSGCCTDDDLELVGGSDVLDDPEENELLAILHRKVVTDSHEGATSSSSTHPCIQRSKSEIVLPPAVDHDVAEAIQDAMVMTIPSVKWTAAFEIPYLQFKRKRRGAAANLSSAQLFRSFLMTPVFRQMHATTYGATHVHEDSTGDIVAPDLDPMRKRGLQKRFHKLAKPIRESLELSLSTHMLQTLDHMTTMYTAARRDFLASMSAFAKYERHQTVAGRDMQARLAEKREKMRHDVEKTREMLAHVVVPLDNKTPRVEDFLKPAAKRTKDHSTAWKRIKDIEQCNAARGLEASVAYAKMIHTDGIGGGITTEAVLARQHDALAGYILYIQRTYRGHLARRYVWALKWTCCMWKHIFYPPLQVTMRPPDGDELQRRGFLRLDDFEATYDYFCFQCTPERVYLAGFALTVPPSRLGPQFVEYRRFKRYWQRFMFRAVAQVDRIRFVQFVKNRQTVVATLDGQRSERGGDVPIGLGFLALTDDWKKYSMLKPPPPKTQRVETPDKYQTNLSDLNDDFRALGLKARRALLPKDQQDDSGWELVRDVVNANTMRQTKYKSVGQLVSHLQDVDVLEGRRRISMLKDAMRQNSLATRRQAPSSPSPKKEYAILDRLMCAVSEARSMVNYFEEVGVETADELGRPAPPCMARLDKIKHVRGHTKLAELIERQQALNHLFQDSWFAFNSRKAIMGPDGKQIVASTRNYVVESMHLLSLIRRQLGASKKVGATVHNLHRTKRMEQYHELLMAYDINVRNMSVVLEGYEDKAPNDDGTS
ncbi:Aste57867_13184 [Aphanomyces stellatus]|uniref:Aste57867_13184 protein n=1 Tax=Aphanomyces stellatus TaxID=120398 RepID=A0A485KZJ5_9STRA|nr:hypothetical protein As57867_013135 [Aphanomyces stellatus]VFT90025.1 Aste57867_13184 [Aphanomyces stellatus]